MKVKSCYLARLIENEDAVKEYTEKLGCTVRHRFAPREGFIVYTIEDATGNKSVLVVASELVKTKFQGDVALRVVVDNINEAIECFKADGYSIVAGTIETESNILCAMHKGDEYRILFEHKQNH